MITSVNIPGVSRTPPRAESFCASNIGCAGHPDVNAEISWVAADPGKERGRVAARGPSRILSAAIILLQGPAKISTQAAPAAPFRGRRDRSIFLIFSSQARRTKSLKFHGISCENRLRRRIVTMIRERSDGSIRICVVLFPLLMCIIPRAEPVRKIVLHHPPQQGGALHPHIYSSADLPCQSRCFRMKRRKDASLRVGSRGLLLEIWG